MRYHIHMRWVTHSIIERFKRGGDRIDSDNGLMRTYEIKRHGDRFFYIDPETKEKVFLGNDQTATVTFTT